MDYDDAYVDVVYKELDKCCETGSTLYRNVFIGGDWNARIGNRKPGDDESVVGMHGVGVRNKRDEWLLDWAVTKTLNIEHAISQEARAPMDARQWCE